MKNALSLTQCQKPMLDLCICGNPMSPGEFVCAKCGDDLAYNIASRTIDGVVYTLTSQYTLDEFIGRVKKAGISPVGTCAICGGHYIWGGNNPRPVIMDEDSRCCTRCNDVFVIPARMTEIMKSAKQRPDAEESYTTL